MRHTPILNIYNDLNNLAFLHPGRVSYHVSHTYGVQDRVQDAPRVQEINAPHSTAPRLHFRVTPNAPPLNHRQGARSSCTPNSIDALFLLTQLDDLTRRAQRP